MNIIYEDNHILVIDKPKNVPSQQDASQDDDVVKLVSHYLKTKYQKPGNVYVGLLHRLDRPVSGLMVIAKTSKAALRLSAQFQQNQVIKHYHAIVMNGLKPQTYTDFLSKDTKSNTSFVTNETQGKKATLTVLSCEPLTQNYFLLNIALQSGRPHQIRVQCASRKAFLFGDQRYNPYAKKGQQIALKSTFLQFTHPTTKEVLSFKLPFEPSDYLNI